MNITRPISTGVRHFVKKRLILLFLACLPFFSLPSKASHMFGADLYYTHVTGHTYTITMVIFADCDLTNLAFNVLPTVTPEVTIYNGSQFSQTVYLNIVTPSTGVEVTPVCPSQLNNTSCRSASGTVPGIKKYTYSKTVNLGSASSNWRFLFTGNLGSITAAGRSNSLTNIIITSTLGSLMGLEASLNSMYGPNSSPVYTTIPTPFFCINKAVSYNPGAIDPNIDSLHFSLVPGIDRQTGGFTSYVTGLSAGFPLHVATNSFSTSSTTGQINFTPNQTQRSLVVSKVSEYRNQVLVGTSMREMTFLVFNNCNNNPPGGSMTMAQGGAISQGTEFTACAESGTIQFQIPATDLDGDTIDMTATGIPSTASFPITNNRSRQPVGEFSWNLQGVTPGTYTFFVTFMDYGCPLSSRQTIAYNIHIKPRPRLSFVSLTPATCVAKSRFNVFPWAGQSPYRLEIWQSATMVHSIQPMGSPQVDSLAPGLFTIRVKDHYGCQADTQITIAQPPKPIPIVETILPTCDQDSNGKILISAMGSPSPYQYSLNGGNFQTSGQFGSLLAGSYTMRVRDANQCFSDSLVSLDNPPALHLDILHGKPRCNFISDGSLEAYAIHGTSPFQFSLSGQGFSTQHRWPALDAGNYTIEVRDSNQCLAEVSYTLVDSLHVHAQALVSEVVCFGDSSGAFLFGAYGTAPPYTYSVAGSPLRSNPYFDSLPAGNYAIHIEDSLGCYLDTTVTITEPLELDMEILSNPISCYGFDDGEIQVSPMGGVSPYRYALDAGSYEPSSTFSPLSPGTYKVHIMDDNGCRRDTMAIIVEPAPLVFGSVSWSDPLCHGGSDGQALVAAQGGTPPYQYASNGGSWQSPASLNGLAAGANRIQVMDSRGCLIDSSIILGQPEPIQLHLDYSHPLCDNIFNGMIDIKATGGKPGYTFSEGTGPYSPSSQFRNLGAGLYQLHVRDSHLCQKDTTLRLMDSLVLHFDANIVPIHCFDSASGMIEVIHPRGGGSPYTYGIGSQALSPMNRFDGLAAGNHRLIIRDVHGCVADTQVQLQLPPRIIPQVQHNEIACHGFNNVQIQVAASGGAPGYQYAIDPGGFQSSGNFVNLSAGTYTIKVRDQDQCIRDTIISLTEPDPLSFLGIQVQPILCHGDSSGMAEAQVSGGTAPYQYRRDYLAYEPGPRLENIPAGMHRVEVRDAKGCLLDTNLLFPEPPPLLLDIVSITHPTCENFEDGEILLQAHGGTPSYTYIHNMGASGIDPRLRPLGAGIHHIMVQDRHGCQADTTITLTGFPPIRIQSVSWTPPLCAGSLDGFLQWEVEGGNPPYAYQVGQRGWQSHAQVSQIGAGEWRLQIRDTESCIQDSLIEIIGPDPIEIQLWSTSVSCVSPTSHAQIGAEVQGGTGAYAFIWETPMGPRQSVVLSQAEPGPYRLHVRDENNCLESAETEVTYENCCNPFLPNAFTPNGDGLNDQIRILYKGDFKLLEFVIVNRYGQVVFQTQHTEQGWDGRFLGVDQDLGTYFYYLKGLCGNQDPKPFEMKGDFILIR